MALLQTKLRAEIISINCYIIVIIDVEDFYKQHRAAFFAAAYASDWLVQTTSYYL